MIRTSYSPVVKTRSALDMRNTKTIVEKLKNLKWDYEITVGVDKRKKHTAPWGNVDFGTLIGVLRGHGYDPMRMASNPAFREDAMRKIWRVFDREVFSRRTHRKGLNLRREFQKGVCRDIRRGISSDIREGAWMFLDKNTIRSRMWKEEVYGFPYESGIDHPLVESGQLADSIKCDIKAIPHSKRFKIATGRANIRKEFYRRMAADAPHAVPTGIAEEDIIASGKKAVSLNASGETAKRAGAKSKTTRSVSAQKRAYEDFIRSGGYIPDIF